MRNSVETNSRRSLLRKVSARFHGDLALSFVLFGICGVVLWEAWQMRPSPYEPLGPAFFPKAIAIIIVILSIMLVGKTFLEKRSKTRPDKSPVSYGYERTPAIALGVFLGTCVFVALVGTGWINFGLLSFGFLTAMAFFLSTAVKVNRFLLLLVAFVLSGSSYLLFTQVFSVIFPN